MPSGDEELGEIRKKIDEIDEAIIDLLAQRMYYANEAKAEKLRMKQPIVDEERQHEVIEKWCACARRNRGSNESGLSEEIMRKMAKLVIEYTVKKEMEER
jgi:chorismate mutase